MRLSAIAFGVSAALLAPSVAAQSDASSNVAAADALFVEARALLARGEREAACKKFDESYRLDTTAMGTLFNLALCNERMGRYATAWRQFRDVTAASRTTRPDRAELSETRARAIEPRLSKLRIVVPDAARAPGLEVLLDGTIVPPASYGTPLPIDGGPHVLTARAPARKSAELRTEVSPERGAHELTVPTLAIDPDAQRAATQKPPPPLSVAPTPPPRSPALRTAGWVTGAVGAAGLLVGAGFGTSVLVQVDDVSDRSRPFAERRDKYDQLDTQAQVATIAIVAGSALLAAGAAILILTKPTPTTTATQSSPPRLSLSF